MATYRVTCSGSIYSHITQNVFHLQTEDFPATTAQAASLAQGVYAAWVDNFSGRMSNDLTLDYVDVVEASEGAVGARENGTNQMTQASLALPTWVTVKVQLQTGLRGRARNGRLGLPGVTQNDVENNVLTPTARPLWQAAVDGFVGDVVAGTEAPIFVVRSTILDGAPRPLPLETPVTNVAVVGIGSQNLRKP